jgi:hypothetical protein
MVLVLELSRDIASPPEWVRATVSRPGTEGAMNKVWPTPLGFLDGPLLADIAAYVAQVATMGFLTSDGVQGSLSDP